MKITQRKSNYFIEVVKVHIQETLSFVGIREVADASDRYFWYAKRSDNDRRFKFSSTIEAVSLDVAPFRC